MKRFVYILIAFLPAFSCSKLNQKPQDFISPDDFYSSIDEAESALLGVYGTLSETALYANYMQGRMGLSADLGYDSYTIDWNTVAYNTITSSDAKITSYWKALYKGIGRANMLLEKIKYLDPGDERDRIEGEAEFLRAYYYFMLVLRFGDVPLVLEPVNSTDASSVQIHKTPKKDVYNRIVTDMLDAADKVKTADEVESGGRVNQSAVYGILARVGLNMAGYPCLEEDMYHNVKLWAKWVIDCDMHSLNPSYPQIFINYMQDIYDIKESIFEVEFWGNNENEYTTTAGKVGVLNGIRFINEDLAPTVGFSVGTIRTTSSYFEMFEDEDLRRDWTIAPYYLNSNTGTKVNWSGSQIWNRFCGKYRREYELTDVKSLNYNSTNFPILRYADVLLMYCEAVACDPSSTSEEIAESFGYLNQIRRRGFGMDMDTPSDVADLAVQGREELLSAVKMERPRELGYELLRKDDLVRWGEFYENMKQVALKVPDSTSSIYVAARTAFTSVSERDVLWPIPSYELGLNRNLTQNEGW